MKTEVLFLGTGAFDYSPKLKEEFKDKFDKNARRSSAVLLNERILIDCGDHCMEEFFISGKDMTQVTDVFVTHLHRDHFNVQHIEALSKGKIKPLRLWVRSDATIPEINNVEVVRMKVSQMYEVESEINVTGLNANHDQNVCPQHLLFNVKGKKLLYACDGAWLMTDTYNYLNNIHLDFYVIDATCGESLGDYRIASHNSLPMIRMMLPSLKTAGIIDEQTTIYLSHIAPSLHKSHDEIEKTVEGDGLKVAYDGLQIWV